MGHSLPAARAVILLDLAMPVDGLVFARELLWRPHCADVPIIVMSAVLQAERVAANLDDSGLRPAGWDATQACAVACL